MQPRSGTFEEYFRCYPIIMMPDHSRKDDANYGGKIFLPASSLNKLTRLEIRYPMLFSLTNENQDITTHSGVLEFTAEEGRVYIPQWMMSTLKIEPGELIKISSCDLPLGKFVKIEPQSVSFLDITDPKAVLENVLRNFSTLSVNDIIEISYNDTVYAIKVLEVKPEGNHHGICVVETDLETDFAPPVGYVEPDYKAQQQKQQKKKRGAVVTSGAMSKEINYGDLLQHEAKTTPFQGKGEKLSGRSVADFREETAEIKKEVTLDGPVKPLRLPRGQLFFGFPVTPPPEEENEKESVETVSQFPGAGQSLREASKKRRNNKNHQQDRSKVHSPNRDHEPIVID